MKTQLTLFLLLTIGFKVNSQPKENIQKLCIGFYNLENLYDTLDADNTDDADFTPMGTNKWNSAKYTEKVNHMSAVISQLCEETTNEGPVVMGVCELENKTVLNDLIKNNNIKRFNFDMVHYDSPDKRGVDVALLYNTKKFKVTNSKSYTLKIEGKDDFFTRDQLMVSGLLEDEPVHFIVCHWPSRRGGEEVSQPLRIAAADLGRSIIDSILKTDANAKIILMGDLNDDPTNSSVKEHLKTKANKEDVTNGFLFNPSENILASGKGTLTYKGAWNLFDQQITSGAFVNAKLGGYQFSEEKIFDKDFIREAEGKYKGNPFRTFAGGKYIGGYSDHLPVYMVLTKEKKKGKKKK